MSGRTIQRGPATLTLCDGTIWTTEREVTYLDDWRDTPWGPVNFGCVLVGPMKLTPTSPNDGGE